MSVVVTTNLHFYDAANSRNVPSGVHAAVPISGSFAWSQAEIDRMAAIFCYTPLPGAEWARHARCMDIESGACSPTDLPPFLIERRRLGFNDGTGYVNRSNWGAAKQACANAKIPEPFWWVSTLDGTIDVPGAWAVQYAGGMHAAFDLSILLGVNNFHKP